MTLGIAITIEATCSPRRATFAHSKSSLCWDESERGLPHCGPGFLPQTGPQIRFQTRVKVDGQMASGPWCAVMIVDYDTIDLYALCSSEWSFVGSKDL